MKNKGLFKGIVVAVAAVIVVVVAIVLVNVINGDSKDVLSYKDHENEEYNVIANDNKGTKDANDSSIVSANTAYDYMKAELDLP